MTDTNSARRRWEDLSDDEIEAMADADTSFPAMTAEDFRDAVAVSASGRVKRPISIRLDEEVLEYFKGLGPRYQTRINDVLLEHVRAQKAAEWPEPAPKAVNVFISVSLHGQRGSLPAQAMRATGFPAEPGRTSGEQARDWRS